MASEEELNRKDVFVTNAVKHFKYELRGKRRMHKTPAQRSAPRSCAESWPPFARHAR